MISDLPWGQGLFLEDLALRPEGDGKGRKNNFHFF